MVDSVTAVDGEDVADVVDLATAVAEVVDVVHLVEAVEVLARVALPTSRARRPHSSRPNLFRIHLCPSDGELDACYILLIFPLNECTMYMPRVKDPGSAVH